MGALVGERFEIVKELGRGSRGIVYLASDIKKGSPVALKVFPSPSPQMLTDEFRNEFSVLSGVRDPSVIEVYDFGFDAAEKHYFLAEEYFDGGPLSRWAGRLSFPKLAEITARLCQVLQSLHRRGIFHGDLKPNNILIKDNNVKLVDFGLASRFDFNGRQDNISGTLPYMAPELFLGSPIDGRTDLYSLGATLYEVVTGHSPFEGASASALVEKHLFESPVNPIPEGSSFPKEFGFLILRLLCKDPSDRFEEANDVIRALNLQFHFDFPLGPEEPVLSPERTAELQKKNVERLYERAVRYYKDRGDAESRRILAEIACRQGNWDEAEANLEGLKGLKEDLLRLQIALKKGEFEKVCEEGTRLLGADGGLDETQKGFVLNTLGSAFYYLGRYEESETACGKAFESYEKTKDQQARAALMNNLGNLRIREGKWDDAKTLYEESVRLCRERGDVVNEGLFMTSLGYAYHLKEQHEEALSYYRQGEALLEAVGYGAGLAKVKSNLANLLIATGSLEKGEEKWCQAEEIAIEKGDRFLIGYCRLLAGDLLRKKEKPTEALAAYREGKRIFHELKSPNEEEIADRNIAELTEETAKAGGEEKAAEFTLPKEAPSRSLLGSILAINRRISLLHDVDEILEVILDSMLEFTAAEKGLLILKEGGKNVVRALRGTEEAGDSEAFSQSLVERVLNTGELIITVDAMTDERFSLSLSIHNLKLRSVLCLPFRVREAAIGAIYLENRRQPGAFTQETIELLQSFVDQAAIAISNAWVFEELKKGASEIRKSEETLKRSKVEIEELNRRLEAALSEKEVELHEAKQSLASKQAALELKYRYDEILGRSPPMMEVLKLLDRVTESDMSVFLFGESGTGKELIARAIHFNGPRRKGAFVPVNCSAIPETLLEAELFGYLKGAFTGAERDREGLITMADGGTLFLDEVADMPLAMQAKLLRVLEDRQVRPVGSQKLIQVDVRILTASNRDLKELVREKKFREDLFFRIHGVRITLPPLRDRREDLPILIDHFLQKISKAHGAPKKTLTPRAFDLLAAYSWPGNIRELENTLSNACLLSENSKIEPEALRQKEELFSKQGAGETEALSGQDASLRDRLSGLEKKIIGRTLEECHGNISLAAKKLKVARPQLSRLVKKLQLKPDPQGPS